MPIELLVTMTVFALVLLATLVATARVAHGLRMPSWRSDPMRSGRARPVERTRFAPSAAAAAERGDQRTRALTVVDAVVATQRREIGSGLPPPTSLRREGSATQAVSRAAVERTPVPPGGSFRRTARKRVSASSDRRDRGT